MDVREGGEGCEERTTRTDRPNVHPTVTREEGGFGVAKTTDDLGRSPNKSESNVLGCFRAKRK